MDLRVRVKDKDPNSVGPSAARQSRSKKRLGKLFRDPSPALDAVKRPLSAILKLVPVLCRRNFNLPLQTPFLKGWQAKGDSKHR